VENNVIPSGTSRHSFFFLLGLLSDKNKKSKLDDICRRFPKINLKLTQVGNRGITAFSTRKYKQKKEI